jgi:hypothetical protein
MIEMIPKSIFSNHFTFRTPDHELVELNASQWREVAKFSLKGNEFSLYREGDWTDKWKLRGDFVLAHGGNVVARASKTSVFRSTFDVAFNGKQYALKRPSLWKHDFELRQNDQVIGTVRRANRWSRRTYVNLPNELPLAVQIYLFWLVMIMWNREDGAG